MPRAEPVPWPAAKPVPARPATASVAARFPAMTASIAMVRKAARITPASPRATRVLPRIGPVMKIPILAMAVLTIRPAPALRRFVIRPIILASNALRRLIATIISGALIIPAVATLVQIR